MPTTRKQVTIEALKAIKPEYNWVKCPGCGTPVHGPIPTPYLYLLEDPQMAAKWLVLNGWLCDGKLHGTVVMHGPDLQNPVFVEEHDNVYLADYFAHRKVTPYE
jgi:hypothetical protein